MANQKKQKDRVSLILEVSGEDKALLETAQGERIAFGNGMSKADTVRELMRKGRHYELYLENRKKDATGSP